MVKRLLLIAVFWGILTCSHGLALNKDSLQNAIKNMPPDTAKVSALYNLATHRDISDTVISLKFANDALALSRKLNYAKGIGKAWQAMGVILYYAHSFERAVSFYQKGADAYKECGYGPGAMLCYHWMARCYRRIADYPQYGKYLALLEAESKKQNNEVYLSYAYEGYGNLFRYLGDYARSIENYTKAIEISERTNNLHDATVALNNLSLVYGILGQKTDELKIQKRTYKILLELKDSSNIVLCLSNLASIYEGQKKSDTAQKYIDMAMNIIKIRGEENLNFKDVASVYGEYANLLTDKDDYLTAVEYYNKAIKLSKDNKDIKSVASGYANLAGVFGQMKNKTMAEEYFLKALDINKTIGFVNGQMENYESLKELYQLQKEQVKADECAKKYVFLKDSLAAMTNAQKMAEAQVLVKIQEQKEELLLQEQAHKKQQEELAKQRKLTYLIGGSAAFILFCLVFALRYRRIARRALLKQQAELRNKEKF